MRLKASLKKDIKIMEAANDPKSLVASFHMAAKAAFNNGGEQNHKALHFQEALTGRVLLTNNKVKLTQLKAVVKEILSGNRGHIACPNDCGSKGIP